MNRDPKARNPDSVLVSLRSLREIERERIERETEAEQCRRAEEQRRVAEAAERQARAELERREREAERRRQEQALVEQRQREERLRLEEATRRARVEAEYRLEKERLAMQMAGGAAGKRRPSWGVTALAGVLAVGLISAGLAWRGEASRGRELAFLLDGARQQASAQRSELDRLLAQLEAERQRAPVASRSVATPEVSPPRPPTKVHPIVAPPKPHHTKPAIGAFCRDKQDPIDCLQEVEPSNRHGQARRKPDPY